MSARTAANPLFKRALVWSGAAPTALFPALVITPSLPKPSPKGRFEYIPINLIGSGGGGGGGGVAAKQAPAVGTTEVKPSLRDLTTLQKMEPKPESKLRSPTDKPKKTPSKKVPDKKAAIEKPDPSAKAGADRTGTAAAAAATGGGSGLTMGVGPPGFGEGIGGELAGQIGVFDFPYSWYLQTVRDKISSNWFTSLVDPGVRGTFQVAVYFRIYRNGTISDIEVKRSSEIPSLDLSAKRAVQNAQPFPPLPPDYDKDYLGIILIFEHAK
jgi:TonB family protein